MTISDVSTRKQSQGNGVTTSFPYDWKIWAATELDVYYLNSLSVEVLLSYPGDYTIDPSGIDNPAGGNVDLVAIVPALGEYITVVNNQPYVQTAAYIEGDDFPAAVHEAALDKQCRLSQQIKEIDTRTMSISPSTAKDVSLVIPPPQAEYCLVWDSIGKAFVNRLFANAGGEVLIHRDHNPNGSHIVYESIADMRESTLVPFPNQVVTVVGFFNGAELRRWEYKWNPTSTDIDDGRIVKLASITVGRFEQLDYDIISPEMFGADGVDDTENFQNAATYAAGGVLTLTPGRTYILNTFTFFGKFPSGTDNYYGVTIPPETRITGYRSKISYDVASTTRVHVLFATGSNITVEGVEFINTTVGAPGDRGVSMSTRVDNTLFDNDLDYENLTVRNCTFRNCFFATTIDFRSYGTGKFSNYEVSGCRVFPGKIGNTGAIDAHAHLVSETESRINGLKYINNYVDGGTNASCLNLPGVHGFSITGNIVKNNGFGGIQTENGTRHGTITGNTVIDCTYNIWIDDSKDITLSGNTSVGSATSTRGMTVTREGFGDGSVDKGPDFTSWVTDNINIGVNTLSDAGIIIGTFGVAGGSFGDLSIIGAKIKITNGASGPAAGISTGACDSIKISTCTIVGAQTTSMIVGADADQITNITNNITRKYAAEASNAIVLTALGQRLISGNTFENADADNDPGTWSGTRTSNIVNGIAAWDVIGGFTRAFGTGTPNGYVPASKGSTYQRLDGGANTSWYVKEADSGLDTGWVAK